VLHYSRDTEEEADREGLHLLNDAKIDRAGMITFFEHLEQKHGASDVPGYLSTHPNPRQRITALSAETKALTNAAEPIMLSLPWKEIRSRCR
jgi:predicted Zn-dependent protease